MMWMLFLLITPPAAQADVWAQANQAYQEERFQEAVELYESILADGVQNGNIHFNLGNAYFKTQQLGKAVLHYYKARKFSPGDEDIANNLALAAESRVDPIIDEEDEAFSRGFDAVAHTLNYKAVFYLSLVMLCMGGLASLGMILKPQTGKWIGYVMVTGSVVGLLLMAAAFLQYHQITRTDMAVIIAKEVNVLSGPSSKEPISFTIHEGISCRVLDENEGWCRIRLANGFNGWMRRSDLEVI